MSKNVREFFEKMQEFFPSTKNAYIESVKEYGEVLETVVIEDIFLHLTALCEIFIVLLHPIIRYYIFQRQEHYHNKSG